LNELTVKFAGCGPAVVAADAELWTVDVVSTPVKTVAANAAMTADAFFNFSPIAEREHRSGVSPRTLGIVW
jgi:hypothetical protein